MDRSVIIPKLEPLGTRVSDSGEVLSSPTIISNPSCSSYSPSSMSSSSKDEESLSPSDEEEEEGGEIWLSPFTLPYIGFLRRRLRVIPSPAFSKSSSHTTQTSPRYLGIRGVIFCGREW